MIAFFRCVAESVAENGLEGLAEMVPGGKFACAVATGAWKKYRERKSDSEIREEIQRLAEANFESARSEAAKAVRVVVPDSTSPEDRLNLELYLSQVPGVVRASLKRPDDLAGKTVPPMFLLNSADDVLKLLPGRPPRFKPNDPLPGLPGWGLVELLGAGGFGEVWLARHRSMSSLCGAVKFCHGQHASELKHESGLIDRVMAAGKHANIVPLINAHLDGDAPWLMYEYISGGTLGDLFREWQTLESADRTSQVVAALKELSSAVAHFHRMNPSIVHRDLKPANILVDKVNHRLRITDFGIGSLSARSALEGDAGEANSAGRWVSRMRGSHTPIYSSPQQIEGQPPDPRDDIHALGVIGYQMFTGQLSRGVGPDYAEDLRECHVPASLILLLGSCFAWRPDRRPATAWELHQALEKSTSSSAIRALGKSPSISSMQQAASSPVVPLRSHLVPVKPSGDNEFMPFPAVPTGSYRDRIKWRRKDGGYPANGRDLVYVFLRRGESGVYHPLFALDPDVVQNLLAGKYQPEDSRLFVHPADPRDELAPEATVLIDPVSASIPLSAPKLSRQ